MKVDFTRWRKGIAELFLLRWPSCRAWAAGTVAVLGLMPQVTSLEAQMVANNLPANLLHELGSAEGLHTGWNVAFQLRTHLAVSNSLFAKLQQSAGEGAVRKRLEAQLHKITLGQRPAGRSEARTGSITVAAGLLLVENRLISVLPSPKDATVISNTVELISSDGYLRRHSFIWHTNLAFPGEVEMRTVGPGLLGLPPAVIKSEIPKLLLLLTNVASEQISGPSGSSCLRVRGYDSSNPCGAAWEVDFDLACRAFPRRIAMSECNGSLTKLLLEPGLDAKLGWMPIQAELSVRAPSGVELYTERWEFTNYTVNATVPADPIQVAIPVDYIVNEYRFTNAFAYVMGNRPPTKEELESMSRDKNAILKYQRDSRLAGRPLPRLRFMVVVVMALLCLLPILAANKSRWFRRAG